MNGLRWLECDRPVPGRPDLMQRTKVLQGYVRAVRNGRVLPEMEWVDVPTVSESKGGE